MKKQYKLTYIIAAIATTLVFIFSSFLVQSGGQNAFAATATSSLYEQSNVLDDLEGSTINGEPFSLDDYNFDNTKSTQLLSFIEFGYSYYSNMQHDYGLYIYIYNPQGINYATNSSLNKITLRVGGNKSDNYIKYNLHFLNQSTAEGTEGLFYKYKILLTEAQRNAVLNTLNSDKRIYEISEVELQLKNSSVIAYDVALTYKYSGFAEGYGVVTEQNSTLTCLVDGLQDKIDLDVKHTVYRPAGDYYEGKQSQLNSCYFRVPEKYFTDYGELSKIACEWYEYVTQPILVTETSYLYQQLYSLHGADVSNFNPRMDFLIMSLSNSDTNWLGKTNTHGLGWTSDFANYDDSYWAWVSFLHLIHITDAIDPVSRFSNFAAVFYTGANTSYKDRYISSDELTAQLLENSKILGGPYLEERYSEALFSEFVNPYHTRGKNSKVIKRDDLFDIFWNVTTKSAWQEIFGGYDVKTNYDSLNAIVEVSESDLKGTNAEISKKLYISESDVDDLKAEFKKCNNERLVLFRFGESDYYSIPCVEAYCTTSNNADQELIKDCAAAWVDDNYTAYMAQETVYLGFDIISLFFTKDDIEVSIPVIASPQDVISGLTPPLKEDYHDTFLQTLKIVLIVIAIVILVIAIILLIIWIYSKVKSTKVTVYKQE